MPNVVVYVKASDWRTLETQGHDPAEWVRATIKASLPEEEPQNTHHATTPKTNPVSPKVNKDVWAIVETTADVSELPPIVRGCVDHRGDPEDWCEACLQIDETIRLGEA